MPSEPPTNRARARAHLHALGEPDLNMAVFLSANLGVMNLLPIPALDGGRLIFLVIEAVRKKPVNRQVEGMVHFAGLMLLMLLMVVVMYNDILKIF